MQETLQKTADNRLITGNISKNIVFLAWPIVVSMLLQTAFNIVDAIWVGRLGPAALAAVSTAGFVVWSVFALTEMIAVGVTAMVARCTGSGDTKTASYVAGQGLVLCVIFSAIVGTLGLYFSFSLFDLMGTAEDVTSMGTGYLRTIFGGVLTIFLFTTINAIFRGSGDTKTPMKVLFMSVLLNAALDPFLIFGLGPFPRMEVAGAALATVISRATGIIVAFYILLSRAKTIQISFGGKKLDLKLMWRILRIGIPVAVAGFLICIVFIFLTKITTKFGTEAVAALGAGHKVQSISYMIAIAFSTAVSTLVGQNMGAGKPRRAESTAWQTCGILSVINGFFAVIYLTLPAYIISIFISDSEVVRIGSNYLKIIAIAEIFMGIESVLEGAFGGAGDTIPPTVISVPLNIARIPLAHYFSIPLGINGV